jgi:hypothetical protein
MDSKCPFAVFLLRARTGRENEYKAKIRLRIGTANLEESMATVARAKHAA